MTYTSRTNATPATPTLSTISSLLKPATFFRLGATAASIAVTLHIGTANAQLPGDTKFIASATENLDGTVTLPVYTGTSGGQVVYYIVTEVSDPFIASQMGVNYSPALLNALNDPRSVQQTTSSSPPYTFPATVTFNSGSRSISPATGALSPTPTGVAPAQGNAGYSPLLRVGNVIYNAPHIRNASGSHPKLAYLNTTARTATMYETDGFQGGQPVRYISTDASTPFLAAAENAVYAPALQYLPEVAHADLALIDNGQRGQNNIQRQGFDSAILDGLDPLNVLEFNPTDAKYSPMWDVHVAQWASATSASRLRDIAATRAAPLTAVALTFPGVAPIVNCPIVARRSTSVATSFTPKIVGLTNRVTNSTFNRIDYAVTARVNDGDSNIPAYGVLVGMVSDANGLISCTTDSTGQCTVNLSLFTGSNDNFVYTISLNHSRQAPGVNDFEVYQAAPYNPNP